MELPRGLQKTLPAIKEKPKTEIKCPVVEKYNAKKIGYTRSWVIPEPKNLGLTYNSKYSLEDVKIFWVLSALKQSKGCFSEAARLLGMGRETIYRLVRELNGK